MRADIPMAADASLFNRSALAVTLYALTATPYDLIAGTGGLSTVDLTPNVAAITQTHEQATIKLAYLNEFSGAGRPVSGQCVSIKLGSYVVFNGIVDSISGAREARGQREITVNVRRRDAFPLWRDVRRISDVYVPGIDVARLARDTAAAVGLASAEYVLPDINIRLAHGSTQLGDMTAWDMISTSLQVGLQEPFIDARGVLKGISRDVRRAATLIIADTQLQQITEGVSRPPLARFRVKWADPFLSKSVQAEKVLASATMTVGAFEPNSEVTVFYSADRLQRAIETRWQHAAGSDFGDLQLVTVSWSPNSDTDTSGVISAASAAAAYVIPGALAALIAAYYIPIPVETTGIVESGGIAISALTRGAEQAVLMFLLAAASPTTSTIEVWGKPYDYVHAVNEVIAYDQNAPAWLDSLQELQNDLIPSHDPDPYDADSLPKDISTAQALAIGELLYRAKAASRSQLVMTDDLRIEPGDILGIPDGRTFYVTGYSRDLGRGAEALLQLDGFFT